MSNRLALLGSLQDITQLKRVCLLTYVINTAISYNVSLSIG